MSYEAMPCVLKNEDGTPMYGLLIKPLQSQLVIQLAPNQQQQQQQQQQQMGQTSTSLQPSTATTAGSAVQYLALPPSQTATTSNQWNGQMTTTAGRNSSYGTASTSGGQSCANVNMPVPNRRHYQAILPRETPTSKLPPSIPNNWTPTASNNGYVNFNSNGNNNFAAALIPTSANMNSTAVKFAYTTTANLSTTTLSNPVPFQFLNQNNQQTLTSSFTQAISSHGFLSASSSLQPHQLQQQQPIRTESQQLEDQQFAAVFGQNESAGMITLSMDNVGGGGGMASLSNDCGTHQMNMNGNSNSSDLDSLLRDIDLSEITNCLMPLLQDGVTVSENGEMVNDGTFSERIINSSNDQNCNLTNHPTSSTATTMGAFEGIEETANQQQQVTTSTSRPPCRYQGLLSNTSNLRVGCMNTAATSMSSTMYSMFDPQLESINECEPSISIVATIDGEINVDKNNTTSSSGSQMMVQAAQNVGGDYDHASHEATTPDSGIQSIGDSPHAVPQSSPLPFFLSSSPEARRRRISSPRSTNGISTTTSMVPQKEIQQQATTSSDLYLSTEQTSSKLDQRLSNEDNSSTWTSKYMQPLSVNTTFFEPISECESSSPNARRLENSNTTIASTTGDGSAVQFSLLNTPRCYSPSTTNSDCGNDRRGCGGSNLTKRKRRTKKRTTTATTTGGAEFDDMPVLQPEGSTEIGTKKKGSNVEGDKTEMTDADQLCQLIKETGKTKIDDDQLTLNVGDDPDALVEKLLSVVPQNQLASLRRILDERLNGTKRDNGASMPTGGDTSNFFKNRSSTMDYSKSGKTSLPRWQSANLGYASDTSDVSSLAECQSRAVGKKTTEEEGDSATSSVLSPLRNHHVRRSSASSSSALIGQGNTDSKKEDPLKKLLEYRAKARFNCVKTTLTTRIQELIPNMAQLRIGKIYKRGEIEKTNISLSAAFRRMQEKLLLAKEAPILVKEQEKDESGPIEKMIFNNLQNLETEASDDEDGGNNDDGDCFSPCPDLAVEQMESTSRIGSNDRHDDQMEKDVGPDEAANTGEQELVEVMENPQRKNISVKIKLSLLRGTSTTDSGDGKGKRSKTHSAVLPPKKRFKEREPISVVIDEFTVPLEMEKKEILADEDGIRKLRQSNTSNKSKKRKISTKPLMDTESKNGNELEIIVDQSSTNPKEENEGTLKNKTAKYTVRPGVFRRCGICKTWIRVEENNGQAVVCGDCRKNESASTITAVPSLIMKSSTKGSKEIKSTDLDITGKSANRTVKASLFAWKCPRKTFAKSGILYRSTGSSDTTTSSSLPQIFSPSQCRLLGEGAMAEDFLLPYDIWWHQLYQKDFKCINPSENYRKLRSNVYIDAKPATGFQHHVCSCKPSSADASSGECGDGCLNRMMFTECCSTSCPCGDQCTNNRFQKRKWALGLETFSCSSEKGMGVKTKKLIKEGTFVCEYLGEVVNTKTFGDRMSTWYKNCNHHYALTLDAGTVIDGYRCGSIARFINHSCEPNCEMQKWWVNGQYRMGVFALRNIEPGEELCYNYKFHAFNTPQVCLCGSKSCRGFVDGGGSHQTRKSIPKRSNVKEDLSDTSACKLHLLKPLSHRERVLVIKRRLFLLRNVDGVRKKLQTMNGNASDTGISADDEKKKADIILSQLTALKTSRCIRTRRLAGSEDDVQIQKLTGLVQLLKSLLNTLMTAQDPDGKLILTQAKKSLNRSSKKQSTSNGQQSNEKSDNQLDFGALEKNVERGYYTTPVSFDKDIKLFLGQLKTSDLNGDHKMVTDLERIYESAKLDIMEQLKDVLGFELPTDFVKKPQSDLDSMPSTSKQEKNNINRKDGDDSMDELYWGTKAPFVGTYEFEDDSTLWSEKGDTFDKQDDKVHCVCGICEDDGMMIQCDRCRYWQHSECVGVDGEEVGDDYACEFCTTGNLSLRKDVVMSPQPEFRLQQCIYYRSLLKKEFQVRIGECVYVKKNIDERHKQLLRNFNRECVQANSPGQSSTTNDEEEITSNENGILNYRSMYRRSELRVFRVERLFTGPRGVKFVFGSYFARPHETFCEPSRRFYRNEIFVTPLYDTLPLDAVVGRCLVVDVQTYCKGRPKYPKYAEEDIYICEYRLDKGQRLFDKMHVRNRYPICTSPYIFEKFEEKLRTKRDFTPFNKKKRSSGNHSSKSLSTISKIDQSKKSKLDARGDDGKVPVVVDNRFVAKKKSKRMERLIDKLKKDRR